MHLVKLTFDRIAKFSLRALIGPNYVNLHYQIHCMFYCDFSTFYQLAAREVSGRLVLRLLCVFRVCWYIYLCVRTYHVCNNYVTYVVAMRPCLIGVNFDNLDGCFV